METKRFKIGGVPEHFNLPWKLAIEEGKFREKNIHLHWEDMTGGTGQMVRGLENKSLDIAVLLTEGITKAILQGLEATILQVYVTSPLAWGIHVPFNSEIQTVADVQGGTFAISRTGSGSHLMAYVLADQQGWRTDDLKFKVIGDLYGGLWSLEHNEAQAFLWEKFTTKPFVDQKKCRFVGEVLTPWPCFSIAIRNECLESVTPETIKDLLSVINTKAFQVKESQDTPEVISWRYGLMQSDVRQWLNKTEWNYAGEQMVDAFRLTVDYLLKLGLVTAHEAENFEHKLFHNNGSNKQENSSSTILN